MKIGRSIAAAIATHAGLTITHGAVTDIADQTDIATHAALATGIHGVGAAYVALGAHAAMPAVDRDSDINLGADFKRAGEDNYLNFWGGQTHPARLYLFGRDNVGNPGGLLLHVPNAAKTALVTALEISGATDTPTVTVARIPRARIPDWDHAATHENGGADEINVVGLSGQLADDQLPDDHNEGAHINRNRTLPLAPFLYGTGVRGMKGYFETFDLSAGAQYGVANFQIPVGFVSFVSAIVGIIPAGDGTFDWTADAEQLDNGEAIGTGTDTATADGQAGTGAIFLELDITAALDGLALAVGDWVGVRFRLDVLATIVNIGLLGLSVTLGMDE